MYLHPKKHLYTFLSFPFFFQTTHEDSFILQVPHRRIPNIRKLHQLKKLLEHFSQGPHLACLLQGRLLINQKEHQLLRRKLNPFWYTILNLLTFSYRQFVLARGLGLFSFFFLGHRDARVRVRPKKY